MILTKDDKIRFVCGNCHDSFDFDINNVPSNKFGAIIDYDKPTESFLVCKSCFYNLGSYMKDTPINRMETGSIRFNLQDKGWDVAKYIYKYNYKNIIHSTDDISLPEIEILIKED